MTVLTILFNSGIVRAKLGTDKDNMKTKKAYKQNYVKINASRGYGNQIFKVIAFNNDTYTLKAISGDIASFEIYKAHCYQDVECLKLSKGIS